jgi:hypothetical protein
MLGQEMSKEGLDVFLSVPQSRKVQANSIDSKIQLFAKSPGLDFFFQVSRSRCDYARLARLVFANLSVGQNRKQCLLAFQIQFVNSVQKERPAILCGPVTLPQLGPQHCEKLSRLHRPAANLFQWYVGLPGQSVDHPPVDFLPGSAFAHKQHRDVGLRDLLNHGIQVLDSRRLSTYKRAGRASGSGIAKKGIHGLRYQRKANALPVRGHNLQSRFYTKLCNFSGLQEMRDAIPRGKKRGKSLIYSIKCHLFLLPRWGQFAPMPALVKRSTKEGNPNTAGSNGRSAG